MIIGDIINPLNYPLRTIFCLCNQDGYWFKRYRIKTTLWNDGTTSNHLEYFSECGSWQPSGIKIEDIESYNFRLILGV